MLLYRIAIGGLLACALGVAGLVASSMRYAPFVGDDFWWLLSVPSKMSFPEFLKYLYVDNTMRWGNHSVEYLLAQFLSIRNPFPVWPLVLQWSVLCVAMACFLGALGFFNHLSRLRRSFSLLAAALVVLVLHWSTDPEPGETFYWLAGANSSVMPFSFGLLFWSWLIAFLRKRDWRLWNAGFVALLAFGALAMAMHEIVAALHVALFAAGAFFLWLQRDRRWRAWTLLAVLAVLVLASVVLTPGTAGRSGEQMLPTVAERLEHFVRAMVTVFFHWPLQPATLLFAALLFLMPDLTDHAAPDAPSRHKAQPWVFLALWGGAVALPIFLDIAMLTPALTESTLRARLVSMSRLFFIIGGIAYWRVFLARYSLSRFLPPRTSRIAAATVMALLSLAIVSSPNTVATISDYRNSRFEVFKNAWLDRYKRLDKALAQGRKSIVLPRMPDRPSRFLWHVDLTQYPTHYANEGLALLYDGMEIRVEAPAARKAEDTP